MKICLYCDMHIKLGRRTCGSDECRQADSIAYVAGRTAIRAALPLRTRRGDFTPAFRVLIHERDGWVCHLCNDSIDRTLIHPHRDAAVVDHIVPLVLGGSNDPSNLASSHAHCNGSKGVRLIA